MILVGAPRREKGSGGAERPSEITRCIQEAVGIEVQVGMTLDLVRGSVRKFLYDVDRPALLERELMASLILQLIKVTILTESSCFLSVLSYLSMLSACLQT